MPEGDVVQAKKSFMGMPVSSKPFLKALRYGAHSFNKDQCLNSYHSNLFNIVTLTPVGLQCSCRQWGRCRARRVVLVRS